MFTKCYTNQRLLDSVKKRGLKAKSKKDKEYPLADDFSSNSDSEIDENAEDFDW